MKIIIIRKAEAADTNWILQTLRDRWGSERIVTRGRLHNAIEIPGVVIHVGDKRVGHAAYRVDGTEMEIVSLTTTVDNIGIGTALLNHLEQIAKSHLIRRIWLITTNDNVNALAFWQKRGYRIVKVHPNAIEESRRLKPEIPRIAENGIEILDELELEKNLE